MRCRNCGTENETGQEFCIRCGSRLPVENNRAYTIYFWIIGAIALLLLLIGAYALIIEPNQSTHRVLEVGRWYFVSGSGSLQNLRYEIQFNADGTCLLKTPQMDRVSIRCTFVPIKKIRLLINGIEEMATYSCDGRSLTLNLANGSYIYQSNPASLPPQPTPTARQPSCISRDGAEMILIPAYEFQMGAIDGDAEAKKHEKPRHAVYTDAFCIDKTEVSNSMFMKCVSAGYCRYQTPQWINPNTGSNHWGSKWPDHPAIYVNWENADSYCRWAGKRLPTEAEWEKAARGTHTNYLYPWGNDLPDPPRANFARYFGNTREVGTLPGGNSFWKVMDLSGNVWEWVSDWYASSYPSARQVNPTGPSSGKVHVLRGGSWFSPVEDVRITSRSFPLSEEQEQLGSGNWGFRCAMGVAE